MSDLILAIDQGTTSSRAFVLNSKADVLGKSQMEHRQYYPRAGWVEHDATEIWTNTQAVCLKAMQAARIDCADVAGIGITNQRETIVIWNKYTGKPCGPALVWQDTRTQHVCDEWIADVGMNCFQEKTGLPIATYFSASKLSWCLDHIDGLREQAEAGKILCGTIDSWLIWNMTGGEKGGAHVTDVTNASRTQLMNLHTRQWDEELLAFFNVPRRILPAITPSCQPGGWGKTSHDLIFGGGIPVCGALGDQQAALFGQSCQRAGEAKNTYGTGCFLLMHTGETPIVSSHGLLTTVAASLPGASTQYALEGSVAVAGSLIQWLRDNLGIIETAAEVETLAVSVPDNGGVSIVPAFCGLFAPYWRSDARGIICGLTGYANKAHLARAALEATAFQTVELYQAMAKDLHLQQSLPLRVDGGMVANHLLMQIQADLLQGDVIRPSFAETTVLGAAYLAGLSCGVWGSVEEVRQHWKEDARWLPVIGPEDAKEQLKKWQASVVRSFNQT